MTRKFAAFSALVVFGLGLLLAGCGDQTASGSSGESSTKDRFLAERGGGATTVAGVAGTPVPGDLPGGNVPALSGTVQKVEGDKITIKRTSDGTENVVQLVEGATIRKQVEASVSDIREGEGVVASGTRDGSVLVAQTVQIGGRDFVIQRGPGAFGTPGVVPGTPGVRANRTPGVRQGGAFPGGTPPAGFPRDTQGVFPNAQGTPGVAPDFVAGTVTKVDGDTVTVKLADDSTAAFKVSADTRLRKQVDAAVSDIEAGVMISAAGQQNGDLFEATSVQLLDGSTQQRSAP